MRFRLYLPLLFHIVPTALIAYLWIIPNGPVAGINDHSIGFASSLVGTIAAYHAGIRLARRAAARSSDAGPATEATSAV